MPGVFKIYVVRLILLLVLYKASACNSENEVQPVYNAYTFDQQVINKLPLYDSLAGAILEQYTLFQKMINVNDGYQAFSYMPTSTDTEPFKKLPQEAGTRINRYYEMLGKDFIYGFDLFKDSSIKIYVRSRPSKGAGVDIDENLSYYPLGGKMKKREFPVKDTVINKNWQYWTRVRERGLF